MRPTSNLILLVASGSRFEMGRSDRSSARRTERFEVSGQRLDLDGRGLDDIDRGDADLLVRG